MWLTKLFDKIMRTEKMLDEWRRSTLILIYMNKRGIQNCVNYRKIKLVFYYYYYHHPRHHHYYYLKNIKEEQSCRQILAKTLSKFLPNLTSSSCGGKTLGFKWGDLLCYPSGHVQVPWEPSCLLCEGNLYW